MRFLINLLFFLFLLTPNLALGQELKGQPYFSISGLVASADSAEVDTALTTTPGAFSSETLIETNVGYAVQVSLGWLLDSNWRGEVEIGHRQLGLDANSRNTELFGNIDTTSLMLNLIRDFRSSSIITPYLGLGIGMGYHQLSLDAIGNSTDSIFRTGESVTFAYQAMAGINLEIADNWDLTTGYRFKSAINPDFGEFSLDNIQSHNFELGLKFYFEDYLDN